MTAGTGFAQLLRGFRLRSGLTQERLAELCGLSSQAVSALENGRRRYPRSTTVDQLSGALALDADDRRRLIAAARRPKVPNVRGGVPRQLPPPLSDFIGRSRELDELVALLRSPAAAAPGIVISAIGGMGGVGKTALAVQAASQTLDGFPDGQLYLNLRGGTEPRTAEDALGALLGALALSIGETMSVDVMASRYRSALAGRRMLIVLDDAASGEQVQPLLPGTAGVVVIVTSRQRLTTLPGARHIGLEVMQEDEGLDLLREVVGAAWVDRDPEAAREVVRRCGLLPLAIRVAGVQAARSDGGLRELAHRLAEDSERLDLLSGSVAMSLKTLAKGSNLDQAAARSFVLLSVFDGDRFPLRAAAAVLDRTLAETESLLERLVDIHLLETPALHQYRMHDLVRAVARADADRVLDESGWDQLRRREADCYLAMLWRFDELACGPEKYGSRGAVPWSAGAEDVTDQELAGDWLEAELPNLVRLIRRTAQDGESQLTAVRMALGMPKLSNHLMRFGEAHQALAAVVDLPITLDPRLELGVLYQMGFAYSTLGLYEQAVPWRQRALPLARALGDPEALAAVLTDLGYNLGRSGRAAEGLPYAEEALTLTEAHPGAGRYRIGALIGFGALTGWLGDLDRQWSAFEQAMAMMPARKAPAVDAVHCNLIGQALMESGNRDAAVRVLTENLDLVRRLGTEVVECDTLETLGRAWLVAGDHARARGVLETGLAIAVRHPGDHREGRLRHYLGQALAGLELAEEARDQWERAQVLYSRVADPRAEVVQGLLSELQLGGGLGEGFAGGGDQRMVGSRSPGGDQDPAGGGRGLQGPDDGRRGRREGEAGDQGDARVGGAEGGY
ncbi:XRE family transcriptional regulator [Kribbella lupini]|uniref:XRE family transcriptional regulator n=1 Tax=Kribbella lupini TaxID=291602 RepID=A0ABN2BMZ3_9ACTN